MDAPAVAHPSREALAAYGSGRADEPTRAAVSRHLEGCDACRRLLVDLSSGRPGATPAPDKALGELPRPGAKPAEEPPKYEIVRELGGGGMGVVYLVRNVELNRYEAFKVMRPSLVTAPAAVERFRQEVLASSALEHDNIVRVYAFVRTRDHIGFTMQFEDGTDLDRLVKGGQPLSVARACQYIHQAAEGLQFAHQRGVVHRDIKPSNLMLVVTGKRHRVKILDFGLAKAAAVGGGPELTKVGSMMGTPAYMAPEQAVDTAAVDIRADIYSLGCSLYFLLAGRAPFGGHTAMQLLFAHREQEAERLDRVRADVPSGLADVVAEMMAKDPARRFQTPAEVSAALAPFFRRRALSAPGRPAAPEDGTAGPWDELTADRTTTPAVRPAARSIRWWRAGAAAATLLLALVALAVWASGTLKVQTQNGVIVIENLPADADVQVDGEKVTLVRNGAETVIAAVREGPHRVRVTQRGTEVQSNDVSVRVGGDPVRISFVPRAADPRKTAPPRPVPSPNPSDPPDAPSPLAPAVTARPGATPEHTFGKRTDERWVVSSAMSPDGRYLFVGGDRVQIRLQVDTPIRVMDLGAGREPYQLPGNACRISSIAMSADGKQLASVSGSGPFLKHVRIWDLPNRRQVHDIHLPSGIGDSVLAFGPKNTVLACGIDETVRVWDARTGTQVGGTRAAAQEKGSRDKRAVRAVTFTPAADRVLVGLADGSIARWVVGTGTDDAEYKGHTAAVTTLAFSADGATLISTGLDKTVRLWDAGKATPTKAVPVGDVPTCAALSGDGRWLVVGCEDGKVRVLSVSSGDEVAVCAGHTDAVTFVGITPDQERIVSGAKDGTTRTWKLTGGAPIRP